jgi:hypothetical protein
MNPLYKIIERESLSDVDRNIFAELLKKQGKVEGDVKKFVLHILIIFLLQLEELRKKRKVISEKKKRIF